ncbi:hypothetical protein WR25_17874 isoform B [Diploscapter pachys]|uniref:Uncharacterized protein n=1 Tax=Diploscapter pachys TaxID=2018661 RepID=A0A2A2JSX1_9BILA|nr:hypothetical protein WR25_17874 isoform B [Diploscapter pachys]
MFLRLSLFFTVISFNLHETSGFLFGLLGSSESEEVCEHGKLITRPEINQYFYCNHGDLELIGCLFPLGEFNQSPEYERRIPVGNTVDNKGPNLNDKSITFIRYRCTREGRFLPIGRFIYTLFAKIQFRMHPARIK